MKAELTALGQLSIYPENDLEKYALNSWVENYMCGNDCSTLFVCPKTYMESQLADQVMALRESSVDAESAQ